MSNMAGEDGVFPPLPPPPDSPYSLSSRSNSEIEMNGGIGDIVMDGNYA
jgi:hypothetical protein